MRNDAYVELTRASTRARVRSMFHPTMLNSPWSWLDLSSRLI